MRSEGFSFINSGGLGREPCSRLVACVCIRVRGFHLVLKSILTCSSSADCSKFHAVGAGETEKAIRDMPWSNVEVVNYEEAFNGPLSPSGCPMDGWCAIIVLRPVHICSFTFWWMTVEIARVVKNFGCVICQGPLSVFDHIDLHQTLLEDYRAADRKS